MKLRYIIGIYHIFLIIYRFKQRVLCKQTPTVGTVLAGQVAVVSNDHHTICPVVMSPKYGNNTISDDKLCDQGSKLHAGVSKIPVLCFSKNIQ